MSVNTWCVGLSVILRSTKTCVESAQKYIQMSWKSHVLIASHVSRVWVLERNVDTTHMCVSHSHLPGPRNWQPRALTAAHRLAESCCGFWCCRMSSVMVRSPSDRPARTARTRPSSSTSWQFTKVTSFLCMGRLSTLGLRVATPAKSDSSVVKECGTFPMKTFTLVRCLCVFNWFGLNLNLLKSVTICYVGGFTSLFMERWALKVHHLISKQWFVHLREPNDEVWIVRII